MSFTLGGEFAIGKLDRSDSDGVGAEGRPKFVTIEQNLDLES